MNAYELADELLRDNTQLTVKAANMLRQQAYRIAELEKQCAKYEELIAGWNTPQTKPAHDFNTLTLDTGEKRSLNRLSDEEIHELANKHLRTQDHDGAKVVTGLEDFVRAIEERHGIK